MSKKLPSDRYRFVMTEDGSETLYSEDFEEACHSTSGARAETILHYVEGCQILQKLAAKNSLTILEVGFGTGLGFLTTRELIKNEESEVTFISLEIDKNLVLYFLNEHPELFLKSEWKEQVFFGTLDRGQLIVITGDARAALPDFVKNNKIQWDAIYQDAFSPKRNPTLWTTEWFKLLKDFSTPDVLMSTYSASSSIRKSMIEAGWILYKGEKFGPKRTSTRAKLSGESDSEILLQLGRSPVEAYTDINIRK